MKLKNKIILITGGAGFIGYNTAKYFCESNKIIILDDLSRRGTENNLKLLVSYPNIKFIKLDITDFSAILEFRKTIEKIDVIIHLAAQVAVTTSIENPKTDFKINSIGTFNMLEFSRTFEIPPIFIYASTNKVYGDLSDIKIIEKKTKYKITELEKGINEEANLDFHSPYGCSKGSADQYTRDYFRIYNIPTIVFRQSCIYGENQYGIEDQGWVAWFLIAHLLNKKISIYGNGKQVRDLLYINDLIRAYELSILNIDKTKGQIFNIGGGLDNSLSLLEFLNFLKKELNLDIKYSFSQIRPGDQKIFISDNSKIEKYLNWTMKTELNPGLKKLYNWINNNLKIIKNTLT